MLAAVIVPAVCTRQLLQHCSTAASCSAGPDRSSGRELPQTSQHSITCHLLNSQMSVGKKLEIKSKRTNLPRILYRL